MQRSSRHVFPRLINPIDTRVAYVATKPAVRLVSRRCHSLTGFYLRRAQPLPTYTPPTLSTNRPAPDLGKWGRPQGLSQRFPIFSPTSGASDSTFKRRRDPHELASGSTQVSDGKRGSRSEPSRFAPSGHTKWKKPVPFPMPRTRPESSSRTTSRDPAPHLPNSAAQSLSRPRSAMHLRGDLKDHTLRAKTVPAPSEELFVEAEDFEAPSSDQVHGDFASKTRRSRVAHKERGSLRLRSDFEPSFRNRSRDKILKPHESNAKVKSKPKVLNRIKPEVFIPSIISVGNLSRILRVSLRRPRFICKHSRHSFSDQVDCSGRCGKREWRKRPPTTMVRYPSKPLLVWPNPPFLVLTSEYAVLLAEEFDYKPVVNDEAAFDLYPS